MHRETCRKAYATLKAYREKHRMNSELNWTKISDKKLEEYKALLDYFFAMNNTNAIQFHAIIFDSHQWDHRAYNEGDSDIGISKLYYQLILHKFIGICGGSGSLYVRVDHRNSSTPLENLRRMLNASASKKWDMNSKPVKQLVSENSKKCDLLQLNDVILGAVCAIRNGKHLVEGGKKSKREVAELVLEKSGLKTFEKDSPPRVGRFTIWNMKPRPRRGAP